MIPHHVRILLILGIAAVICGTASAAGMGIIAETHETSGMNAPVCTAPCECISVTEAMHRWGDNGYDYCSKTVCGQSADAMVQYYCVHQIAGQSPAATLVQAPVQTPAAAASAVPAAAGVTQKTPVGIATILAAISMVLLVTAGIRRK